MNITSKFAAMRSGIYDALFGSQSVNVGEMKEASSHPNVKTISMTLSRQASPDDIIINAMIKKIDNKEHLVFTSAPKNFHGMIMRCFFGNKKNVERFYKRGIEMIPFQTTSDDNDFNLNVSLVPLSSKKGVVKSFNSQKVEAEPNEYNNFLQPELFIEGNDTPIGTTPVAPEDTSNPPQSSFFGTPIALASLPSASRSSNDEMGLMGLKELQNKLLQLTQKEKNLQYRQDFNSKIANIEMPEHLNKELVSTRREIEEVKGEIGIASTWREVGDQTSEKIDPAASLTPRSSVTSVVDTDFNSNHPQPSSTASNNPRAPLKSIETPEDEVGIEKIWEIAGKYREHFKRIQVLTQQRESIEKEIQSLTTSRPQETQKETLQRTDSLKEKMQAKGKLIAETNDLISQRDQLITTFSREYPNYRFDEKGNICDVTGKIIDHPDETGKIIDRP
ncbi:MAG: hypothetical protein DVB29_05845 [Verrucomicrobia bacterium]|nr:MAG: hypothetical protein DVB29_05845 [Verrucomicrobiota bacterium]